MGMPAATVAVWSPLMADNRGARMEDELAFVGQSLGKGKSGRACPNAWQKRNGMKECLLMVGTIWAPKRTFSPKTTKGTRDKIAYPFEI